MWNIGLFKILDIGSREIQFHKENDKINSLKIIIVKKN
jgi:hypothetical protein